MNIAIKAVTVTEAEVLSNLKDSANYGELELKGDDLETLIMEVDDSLVKDNDAVGKLVDSTAQVDTEGEMDGYDDDFLENCKKAWEEEWEKFLAAVAKRWAAEENTRLGAFAGILDSQPKS